MNAALKSRSSFRALRTVWLGLVGLIAVATVLGCSDSKDHAGQSRLVSSVVLSPGDGPIRVEANDRLVARTADARFEFVSNPVTGERTVAVTEGEAELFFAVPRASI